jgi:toxin YoeB
MRESVISPQFRDDLLYWAQNDRRTLIRAISLMEAIERDPFTGIGKPEPLKHDKSGRWSRRLTREHRIVYIVKEDRIEFLQARFHY